MAVLAFTGERRKHAVKNCVHQESDTKRASTYAKGLKKMRALLLLMLLPLLLPAKAEPQTQLENKLGSQTLKQWNAITTKVCAVAYKTYERGSIYPQMTSECQQHLDSTLIKEFETRLGD